jgi:hypothetical protein
MDLDDQHSMSLTGRELLVLGAGLKAYLQVFGAHRLEDAEASHPEDQWIELQDTVGKLLWRLEEAAAGPQARIEHSAEARDPNG